MQPGYGIRLLNPFLIVEEDHDDHPEVISNEVG